MRASTAIVLILFAGVAHAAPTFAWLGDLPGGAVGSHASGVSADGKVVVGWSESANGREAFRWEDGSMIGLGDLPGRTPYDSYAVAVSADGATIAGTSGGFGRPNPPQAFLWSAGALTGLQSLPSNHPHPVSQVFGLSDDGAVLVGQSSGSSGLTAVAYRDGAWLDLGAYPMYQEGSAATGVSPEGVVIAGRGDPAFLQSEGFLIAGNGIVSIGDLPGGTMRASPTDVSAEGAVVVGWSDSGGLVNEAFRYADGTMMGLGYLPGGSYSLAYGVSGDGTIIVGRGNSQMLSCGCQDAWIWTEAQGMQRVVDVLVSQGAAGVDRWNWYLTAATAISTDGRTIVGYGFKTPFGPDEGWIVTLDTPIAPDRDGDGVIDAADNCLDVVNPDQFNGDGDGYGNRCDGDMNNDSVTNAQDYALFRNKLGSAAFDPAADLNHNGTVNAQDYAIFRTLLGSPPGPSGFYP